MSDHPLGTMNLSAAGERRRDEIHQTLVGRARARRVGRRVLAGVASVAVLVGGAMVTRSMITPHAERPAEVAHDSSPSPRGAPIPMPARVVAVAAAAPAARITIVGNQPIDERPCGAGAGGDVSVCTLSDSQLLSTLSTTGGSYGIVRVAGRTMVVSNTPR